MDTISFVTHLVRITEGRAGRVLASLGGLALLAFAVLGLAFIVGAMAAELLAPEPAHILAAPFRWRN